VGVRVITAKADYSLRKANRMMTVGEGYIIVVEGPRYYGVGVDGRPSESLKLVVARHTAGSSPASVTMFNNITTVTQGTIGLSIAISWFSINGYIVSIPINDNQDYDLLVDNGTNVLKVQVKTTKYKIKNSKNFTVQLKSVRPNKTINKIIKFDGTKSDLLFIVTSENEKYLIPSIALHNYNAVSLGDKVLQWKIHG
jgi:hypothetical protein